MKNKLRDSRGVVSVFAMLSMLFFLLFIIGAYIGVSRLNKMQKTANKELLELYSSTVDPQAIYNDMIEDVDKVIPVYEYEDLPTNRSRFKEINGKIYYLTPNSSYELKTDIMIPSNVSLYENVYRGDYQYSSSASMKVLLDGENNSGYGHNPTLSTDSSPKYAIWNNLMNLDDQCNIYGGGNIRAFFSGVTWKEDCLVFDGSGMYVLANNVLDENSGQETIEVVFETNNNTKKQYIFSNASISVGITPKTEHGYNHGVFFVEYENDGVIITQETSVIAYNNKKYNVAVTYNGTDVKLYINGVNSIDATKLETPSLNFSSLPYKSNPGKFALGINTYIGTVSDTTSTAGITISPFFVPSYPITPSYRTRSNGTDESKVTNVTVGNSYWTKDYFLNFADLNKTNIYSFQYALRYVDGGVLQNQDITFSNQFLGSSITAGGNALDIIAKGSDSVIIRSNVGKILNWYWSKGIDGNYTTVTPTKEVSTLGSWYYSFNGLESNMSSGVRYWFKGEYELGTSNLLEVGAYDLYIGRKYTNSLNDTLSGKVYAVRAYDSALAEDNIQTNFRIDKTKYGIN